MTADQPLICPRCHGVIAGVPATAYTRARGRLIIANGYCRGGCSDPTPRPADQDLAEKSVMPPEPTVNAPATASASV
ncbi:hypothetical protein B0I32_13711 [Nonomuraea fuscirosea]|uniref:Uncharacterized protein n=1 Tax=Nonomuraea fuscirosea TaxID=1291556 RepID=A0A2T0M1W3_9ACTN|nr:hypothetical protein [Nonomuraea fuscirosea]PRX50724.1 hypothetical protein B0I32_13711 [Nonomuraea fuscirosea]